MIRECEILRCHLFRQDLNLYQESLQTLKVAQTKFQESAECSEKLEGAREGDVVLVPLTGSMYVPGKIIRPECPLVDVGTGYYAEKVSEMKQQRRLFTF